MHILEQLLMSWFKTCQSAIFQSSLLIGQSIPIIQFYFLFFAIHSLIIKYLEECFDSILQARREYFAVSMREGKYEKIMEINGFYLTLPHSVVVMSSIREGTILCSDPTLLATLY